MRTLQQIFDAVIDAGYYPGITQFMCNALERAHHYGVITQEERVQAKVAINDYLATSPCVREASAIDWVLDSAIIAAYDVPPKKDVPVVGKTHWYAYTAIYRDWANRPKLDTPKARRGAAQ